MGGSNGRNCKCGQKRHHHRHGHHTLHIYAWSDRHVNEAKKISSFLSKIKIPHNFALFFSDFFCPHFFLISQAKAQPEPYWPDGGPLWAASADAQWFVPRFASISYSKHMPKSPGGFLWIIFDFADNKFSGFCMQCSQGPGIEAFWFFFNFLSFFQAFSKKN